MVSFVPPIIAYAHILRGVTARVFLRSSFEGSDIHVFFTES